MKGAYIFLANGFEETEALATVDMLRRGGIDIKTVSIYSDKIAVSSHRIPVMTDWTWKEFKAKADFEGETTYQDVLVFPGGMPGSTNLAACTELMQILQKHYAEGGSVAAICAAPSVVLSILDIKGKTMTCYDGFQEALLAKGANYIKAGVAQDGNIITGRGAGHTVDFGLAILAHLTSDENSAKVAKAIML